MDKIDTLLVKVRDVETMLTNALDIPGLLQKQRDFLDDLADKVQEIEKDMMRIG